MQDEGLATPSGWQVFKYEAVEAVTVGGQSIQHIDGRPPATLRYAGRIVEDATEAYWRLNAQRIGERFGEGRFLALADEGVQQWTKPEHYSRTDAEYFDVVMEQPTYRERSDG